MKKISYFLFLFFNCLSFVGNAQEDSPDFLAESILLHTDRQLYISGETVWFKVYALETRKKIPSSFSKLAYLELLNPEGLSISRVKIALEEGQGSGAIELPKGLPSDYYTLRAYTQAMRNMREASFGRSNFIVVNPKQALPETNTNSFTPYQQFEPKTKFWKVANDRYLDIKVATSQMSYPQRGMATVEIHTIDESGQPIESQLSLSIALRAPGTTESLGLFHRVTSPATENLPLAPTSTTFFPAEKRGMHLKGRVSREDSEQGEEGVIVFLSFPGRRALVYTAVTEEDGHFSFLLPKLYGLRQVILQTSPENEIPLTIELFDGFQETEIKEKEPFIIPPKWIPHAQAAMVHAQIGQSYEAFEPQAKFMADNPFAHVHFFGRPDVQYRLDDYTRFPLPEFYFEVVTEVLVRGKYGEENIMVFNDWGNAFSKRGPLLLVDGVPVFDQRTFLNINNKLIASTEIVTEPYLLNPGIFNGIIQITSFEGDARCFDLPETALRRSFLTLLPNRQFIFPDHEATTEKHLPDFRNTLYWNPSIKTNKEGIAKISFYTSDVIGEYEIKVEGVSNQGHLGSGSGIMIVAKVDK